MRPTRHAPLFSVVMPTYNASSTLRRAIGSLISQTYGDWELILTDDCSDDDTFPIAQELATGENRLRLFRLERNSGCAYIPRKFAINKASGKYIVPLDSDDWMEEDYLHKLALRIEETGADIVYSTIFKINDRNEITRRVPETAPDTGICFRGRDLMKKTLYRWEVSGLGAIRKSLYEASWKDVGPDFERSVFADEFLTRCLLHKANVVAFSNAVYYYFTNTASVTQRLSEKTFEILERNLRVRKWIEKNYPEGSEEWILAHRQEICGLADAIVIYERNKKHFSSTSRKTIIEMLHSAYGNIDSEGLRRSVGPKLRVLMRSGLRIASVILRLYERKGGKQL